MTPRRGPGTRTAVAALLAVVFAGALAGCGIPDETDVQVDGRGPASSGSGARDGTGRQPPRREESGDEAEQLVLNFLQAAAGETTGAYQRVNEYIAPQARLRARQGNDVAINVVRLTEETPRLTENPDGTKSVQVAVQHVGVLRANGSLSEAVSTETGYTFTVGRIEATGGRSETSKGYYVLDPPQTLLMSTDALEDYYRARTIYFWNNDRTALVPDLRYLPVAVPTERQATEVLGWLTAGPAGWLGSTAVPLPDGTKAIGNVPAAGADGRLVVNLSIQAGEVDNEGELNRLFTQLAWSLRDNIQGELELKIEHQSRKVAVAAEERDFNQVYHLAGVPNRFCVYAGQVRPLVDPGGSGQVPLPAEANRGVVSASLARADDRVLAALVTAVGRKRQLTAGTGVGAPGRLTRIGGTYSRMSRPVWLRGAGTDPTRPVGLVAADGRLYRFGVEGKLVPVRLPNISGPVTTVAAALDGHRIAVISDGALYVAAVAVDDASVTAGPARRLSSSLRELSAVDWSAENALFIAGLKAGGRVAINQISVDSGAESPVINEVPAGTVPHLAAYPNNPVVPASGGTPMYEGNGVAYAAGERIDLSWVGAVDGGAPPESGNPTAPFFLY